METFRGKAHLPGADARQKGVVLSRLWLGILEKGLNKAFWVLQCSVQQPKGGLRGLQDYELLTNVERGAIICRHRNGDRVRTHLKLKW